MIVDCFTDRHHRFGESYSFKPWQMGLFLELMQLSDLELVSSQPLNSSPFVKSVSLGTWSGHTYFAQICSLKDFPVRTKVYASNHENISEYSSLVLRPSLCHEPVDILPTDEFQGYTGGLVRVVVVDLDNNNASRFKVSLRKLCETMPDVATLVLLDNRVIA